MRYYHVKAARYPWSLKQQAKAEAAAAARNGHSAGFHALLTEQGKEKFASKKRRNDLQGGVDYLIQEDGGQDWMPLGHASRHRHDWVIVPHQRPHVPVVYGALGSRSEQEHITKILVLFCPWTSNPKDATESVPYMGQLRRPDMTSWRQALRCAWAHSCGFPTEEIKRFILNYAFVYCLPRSLQPDNDLAANSDNEDLKDQVYHFEEDELQEAIKTRVRGAGDAQAADEHAAPDQEEEPPMTSTQHDLTMQMINLSQKCWLGPTFLNKETTLQAARTFLQRARDSAGVDDADQMKAAAQASRAKRAGNPLPDPRPGLAGANRPPATKKTGEISAARLRKWLDSEAVRSKLNVEQHEFLSLVVERVLVESNLAQARDTVRKSEEPLVWLLHGRPGTGKSHVLKFVRELFESMLGYVQGIDFVFAAFQATNARDIDGETLHGAFGFSKNSRNLLHMACAPDTSKRIALWRWLVVDEVGMISARLLAQVEVRTQGCVPAASRWKHDAAGNARPFAGLNVIFSGDFWQLPPPEGGFLADLPAKLQAPGKAAAAQQRDPLVEHGRSLFWGGAVQGVTELHERLRCKDGWWNEARRASVCVEFSL